MRYICCIYEFANISGFGCTLCVQLELVIYIYISNRRYECGTHDYNDNENNSDDDDVMIMMNDG